ncbi:MAG: hypothetical protein ABMA64_27665 [Myxococcota bacterium]
MTVLMLIAMASARAESVIEFKTTGPVAIFVDGQQATLTSNLRQRINGLDPGVHQLQVAGMFGKKLYEAEIDLPDNTITYASWERGEIKVLKTEWLAAEEPVAEEEVPADTGAEEMVAAVEPPPEPEPEPALGAAAPMGGIPGGIPESAPGIAGLPGGAAPVGGGLPAVGGGLPAAGVGGVGAVALAEGAVAAPPAGTAAAPVAVAAPVAAPAVAAAETPLAAIPVAIAAPVGAVAAEQAIAIPPPKSNTLTVEAYDGMRVVVTHDGQQVVIVVDGDRFRIQDANGLNLALGGQ